MKKYDLLLLGLFILGVFVFLTILFVNKKMVIKERKAVIAQFEKIYQVPVKTVLIRNTNVQFTVRDANKQLNSQNGIEFSGELDCSDIPCFKILRDTLLIENAKGAFVLSLWKMNDVKVDTVNAPNVISPRVKTITTVRTEINGEVMTKTDTIVTGGI